jgi:hypothetical protein
MQRDEPTAFVDEMKNALKTYVAGAIEAGSSSERVSLSLSLSLVGDVEVSG